MIIVFYIVLLLFFILPISESRKLSQSPNAESQNKKGVLLLATFLFFYEKTKDHTHIIETKKDSLNNV